MPSKDAESITKWYDALSKNYDELYGEEQDRKHVKVLELLGNRKFNTIVDVGCGTGRLLKLLASRSKVPLGIDLSVRMLISAKQRARGTDIQLVRADAAHMPLQDHVAEGVTSVSMTESGTLLEEHFKQLSRIATEGATLVMTIFDGQNQTSRKRLSETGIELMASLSDREQLYMVDLAKHRVRVSSNPRL